MSTLRIEGLRAAIGGVEILCGVDLELRSGEVHVVMGPNGAGKSTLGRVLMGHPDYEVLDGSVLLDGQELLGLPTWRRAQAGLFLAPQDPPEVPGVAIAAVIGEALAQTGTKKPNVDLRLLIDREANELRIPTAFLDRGLNVDSSGGEKKRIETVQLAILQPIFAILDEIDSGLDIDALRMVARRIERLTSSDAVTGSRSRMGALVITHYGRLLAELHPDVVHVLVAGRVALTGGPDVAVEIERAGYGAFAASS